MLLQTMKKLTPQPSLFANIQEVCSLLAVGLVKLKCRENADFIDETTRVGGGIKNLLHLSGEQSAYAGPVRQRRK